MDKYYIPKHLDAPVKILFFTLDEFILSVVPCLFFIFTGMPVFGLIVFVFSLMGIKKFKGDQGISYLKAWAYWHLPSIMYFHVTPPSNQRFYLG